MQSGHAYPGLEVGYLLVCHSIGFGNDGNQIDLGVKPTHELDVNLFQANNKDQQSSKYI
jgi:hypothetical protein